MRHAVILAGGAGKRLWPLSRAGRPKQLLPLLGGKSLLEIAAERLAGLFENDNIFIIANAQYCDRIAEVLPQLPRENIVGEPEGRDTANAIALATHLLSARDPEATMAVFTADHVIRPVERFAEAVRSACDAAEQNPDALLTFGVRPTWPHTGLGYIHCRREISEGLWEVGGFREKPDHPTAQRYVDSGEYYWNSGMFVWKIGAIRAALCEFLPGSMARLAPVAAAASEGRPVAPVLAEVYPSLKKISIDYAVMERAHTVLMVPLNCEWLDVGSWPALQDVLEPDEQGNLVIAENAVTLDSSRNIIVTEDDHLLAVLGMDDCIVVRSPDATLVCKKSDSQRLKDLLDLAEKKYGGKYL